MPGDSIAYARVYVNDRTGQFTLVSVEDFPDEGCAAVKDDIAPFGLHTPTEEELAGFEEKFGYKAVCRESNLFVISYQEPAPPEEPGFLAKFVDRLLSGLSDGIGIFLGAKKKGCFTSQP